MSTFSIRLNANGNSKPGWNVKLTVNGHGRYIHHSGGTLEFGGFSLKISSPIATYEPPVAVSKDSFSGGYTQVDGFLVDMEIQQVLCSFSIAARPNELVSYKYKEGEDPVKALAEFAHSTLWENARQAFAQKMGEMCGGTFVIE